MTSVPRVAVLCLLLAVYLVRAVPGANAASTVRAERRAEAEAGAHHPGAADDHDDGRPPSCPIQSFMQVNELQPPARVPRPALQRYQPRWKDRCGWCAACGAPAGAADFGVALAVPAASVRIADRTNASAVPSTVGSEHAPCAWCRGSVQQPLAHGPEHRGDTAATSCVSSLAGCADGCAGGCARGFNNTRRVSAEAGTKPKRDRNGGRRRGPAAALGPGCTGPGGVLGAGSIVGGGEAGARRYALTAFVRSTTGAMFLPLPPPHHTWPSVKHAPARSELARASLPPRPAAEAQASPDHGCIGCEGEPPSDGGEFLFGKRRQYHAEHKFNGGAHGEVWRGVLVSEAGSESDVSGKRRRVRVRSFILKRIFVGTL